MPRARLAGQDGKTAEWKSPSLRAYQRRTQAAEALIASASLSGTNTRRVRRALAAVFAKEVGQDIVRRTWRKVKGDWDGWNARSLAEEPIIRLIRDGTVVRVRLDKTATSISLLVALGVRADGQKVAPRREDARCRIARLMEFTATGRLLARQLRHSVAISVGTRRGLQSQWRSL